MVQEISSVEDDGATWKLIHQGPGVGFSSKFGPDGPCGLDHQAIADDAMIVSLV